jgi:serine/threonine-protein kinase
VSLKKLGRYELLRVLGKGAMGVVYEGRDPNLDRRVAIKTVKVENLSDEAAAEYEHRFRTEARSAARLQHPNIVSVYDSDRDADNAFLVMEYIQGEDLKHHLDSGARYSLEQSLKMVRDLLAALDYAHRQGIVHRDIKPANLLLEPGGRLKLTDFGVARIQDSGEATRTQGSMVGTLKYMAPEQVQGQKIDARADLFSVGVVLYQLLTDKRPFDGDNDFTIIQQIIGHTPPPPSAFNARLPAAIDAVVARALAKNRDERFATARDFAAALQSAIRRAEDATVVPPAGASAPDLAGHVSRPAPTMPGSIAGTLPLGNGSSVTQEAELVYWKDIKDSAEPDELREFLGKFPEGIYADLARRRLRRLASNTLPGADLTGLAGAATTQRSPVLQDPDATRMPVDGSRGSFAATLPLARDEALRPAAANAWADDTVAPAKAAAPSATSTAATKVAPAQSTRTKKAPVAMIAGVAVLAVAGLAAMLVQGRGTAAVTANAAAPAVPTASAAVVAAAPPTAPAASVAPAPAAAASVHVAKASAPLARAVSETRTRQKASASQPPAASAVAAAPVTPRAAQAPVAPAPTPVAAREESHSAAVSRLVPPSETCKDKIFLAKQWCLTSECAKPGYASFPACVRLREEARLREESKVRN